MCEAVGFEASTPCGGVETHCAAHARGRLLLPLTGSAVDRDSAEFEVLQVSLGNLVTTILAVEALNDFSKMERSAFDEGLQ
jgi:hypothetical protein